MPLTDSCVSLNPYFRFAPEQRQALNILCEDFVARSATEEGCLFYGFSFTADVLHCREGYRDAQGLLAHLENVAEQLQQLLAMVEPIRVEVHGPATELELLRAPLAHFEASFFVMEQGFRR